MHCDSGMNKSPVSIVKALSLLMQPTMVGIGSDDELLVK